MRIINSLIMTALTSFLFFTPAFGKKPIRVEIPSPIVKDADGNVIGKYLGFSQNNNEWLILNVNGYVIPIDFNSGKISATETATDVIQTYWEGTNCTGQGYRVAKSGYPKPLIFYAWDSTASENKTFYTPAIAIPEQNITYLTKSGYYGCSTPGGTLDYAYPVYVNDPAVTGVNKITSTDTYSVPLDFVAE